MIGLTTTQKRAFDFIAERLLTTAIPPTRRELAEHLGSNKTRAQDLVDNLVERGYLRRLPHRYRNVDLARRPERVKYFRFDSASKQLVEWRP